VSWLLPSALIVTGIAALGAIATHFIARSRPLAEPLPTARFIPERAIRARTRSVALSDLLLLLVRVAAIVAIGVAVAGPVIAAAHGRVSRVIVIDRSRGVSNTAEVRDSVRAVVARGDAIVVFDSVARRGTLDSLHATSARGSLSAALAAAIRTGAELGATSDSIELVVISPFVREEIDSATLRIRRAWPGRVRLVRVAAVAQDTTRAAVDVSSATGDAVAAGLSLAGFARARARTRIVRGRMTPDDSAWARAGNVVVHWPNTESDAAWRPRRSIDAIGGVVSASGVLVGRFPRLWMLAGRSLARWADGELAAVENPLGAGCIRDVAVLVDAESDLTLRPMFRDFARSLVSGPCGGSIDAASVDAATLATLAGRGPLARATALNATPSGASSWTPWLLVLGALLLIAELALRRGQRRAS